MIKHYILKNRNKDLSESEALFFGHNRKLLNGNIKVGDFVNKDFKDVEKDGWVHLEYGKQDIYG